jgi:2,3-bisphosphoglycerate-independent phosphoglycerate mutase
MMKKPVVLVVRDGWGENPNPDWDKFNAIKAASTPVDDRLRAEYPSTLIATSGEDVGLPAGIMGNSEVGHQNLGAGRIVEQELLRIARRVSKDALAANPAVVDLLAHLRRTGGRLHLMGLTSDGGVHSDIAHLLALIEYFGSLSDKPAGLFVHAIMDGRDTAPFGGIEYIRQVEERLASVGFGSVASVVGRFYAMDRDFRWERVQKAHDLLVKGAGATAPTAHDAVQAYYDKPSDDSRQGDEFILPTCVGADEAARKDGRFKDGDAVIFFNYRGDRPREITKAFILPDDQWAAIQGGGFDRGTRINDLFFASFTAYEKGLDTHVVFHKPPKMENILGEFVSNKGLAQFRCAESEKHPHVTYFFNDYRKGAYPGEFQLDVPSPRHVETYDLKPEMSAFAVAAAVENAIASGLFDFILVNFANGDMVGHTGSMEAAVKAVEAVDQCVGKVVDATLAAGGRLVVTADHGNAELMWDADANSAHTRHTTFTVRAIVVSPQHKGATLRDGGRLADVAPTVLDLMGLDRPAEMTGVSLLKP